MNSTSTDILKVDVVNLRYAGRRSICSSQMRFNSTGSAGGSASEDETSSLSSSSEAVSGRLQFLTSTDNNIND